LRFLAKATAKDLPNGAVKTATQSKDRSPWKAKMNLALLKFRSNGGSTETFLLAWNVQTTRCPQAKRLTISKPKGRVVEIDPNQRRSLQPNLRRRLRIPSHDTV
jgi:hypothetical protein